MHLFGSGKVRSVASSKAVFLGMGDVRGDDGVHLALPPVHRDLPPLDEYQLSEIAQELQSRLLMYRLRNLDDVRKFSPSKLGSIFVGSEVARNLAAGVLGEAEILEPLARVLRRLEQDSIAQRGCDVHLAMIEVAWAPSHADRELSISRLTDLTNTLLRLSGETLEYSTVEIGWKLRNFGFRHHRNGRGMVLQLSYENRLLLHQLAARLSLNLPPVADCALCSPQEAVDSRELM